MRYWDAWNSECSTPRVSCMPCMLVLIWWISDKLQVAGNKSALVETTAQVNETNTVSMLLFTWRMVLEPRVLSSGKQSTGVALLLSPISSITAEVQATRNVLTLASMIGCDSIQVESDSTEVQQRVCWPWTTFLESANGKTGWNNWQFDLVEFKHCRREANGAARHIQ